MRMQSSESASEVTQNDVDTMKIEVHGKGNEKTLQFLPGLLVQVARNAGMGSDVHDRDLFNTSLDNERNLVVVTVTATQQIRSQLLVALAEQDYLVTHPGEPQLHVFPAPDETAVDGEGQAKAM